MADPETIAQNIRFLQKKIAAACETAGRRPESVHLIAVGKTFGAEKIRSAVAAGARNIGENYMQESINKMSQLSDLTIVWHFIGRLQKNKARDAARHFDWVHTVENAALARRLSAARNGMPPLNICLQINIDREESKGGVAPEDAAPLAREIYRLPALRLRGLMAIPRPRGDSEDKRVPVRALAALRTEIARAAGAPLDALSIGMSDDFEDAVAEGATHVRIGRAIFGERETP
ncbi:MAG: YggS family pyridoxal phosphate-dependent enzyme [Gammaproteobacteria bacterium]